MSHVCCILTALFYHNSYITKAYASSYFYCSFLLFSLGEPQWVPGATVVWFSTLPFLFVFPHSPCLFCHPLVLGSISLLLPLCCAWQCMLTLSLCQTPGTLPFRLQVHSHSDSRYIPIQTPGTLPFRLQVHSHSDSRYTPIQTPRTFPFRLQVTTHSDSKYTSI